jgi:hypothetical protein
LVILDETVNEFRLVCVKIKICDDWPAVCAHWYPHALPVQCVPIGYVHVVNEKIKYLKKGVCIQGDFVLTEGCGVHVYLSSSSTLWNLCPGGSERFPVGSVNAENDVLWWRLFGFCPGAYGFVNDVPYFLL